MSEIDETIKQLGGTGKDAKLGRIYRRETLKTAWGPWPKGSEYALTDAGLLIADPPGPDAIPGAYVIDDARSPFRRNPA